MKVFDSINVHVEESWKGLSIITIGMFDSQNAPFYNYYPIGADGYISIFFPYFFPIFKPYI